jgi:hypothetical protein
MRRASMAAAIGLAACASGPREVSVPPPEIRTVYSLTSARGATRDVETTRATFDRPHYIRPGAEEALRSLPAIYAALGIPGSTVLNADEHLFGRQQLHVRLTLGEERLSRIVRCGSLFGSGEAVNPVTLTVMTLVEPMPAGTRVRSWVDGSSRDMAGSGSAAVQCASTGWLEREIVRRLDPLAG